MQKITDIAALCHWLNDEYGNKMSSKNTYISRGRAKALNLYINFIFNHDFDGDEPDLFKEEIVTQIRTETRIDQLLTELDN